MHHESCLQLRAAAKRCGQLRQRPWQQRRRYKATRHRQGSCKRLSSSSSRIEKTRATGGCKSIAAASTAQAARWAWPRRGAAKARARVGRLDLARVASPYTPYSWLRDSHQLTACPFARIWSRWHAIGICTIPHRRATNHMSFGARGSKCGRMGKGGRGANRHFPRGSGLPRPISALSGVPGMFGGGSGRVSSTGGVGEAPGSVAGRPCSAWSRPEPDSLCKWARLHQCGPEIASALGLAAPGGQKRSKNVFKLGLAAQTAFYLGLRQNRAQNATSSKPPHSRHERQS